MLRELLVVAAALTILINTVLTEHLKRFLSQWTTVPHGYAGGDPVCHRRVLNQLFASTTRGLHLNPCHACKLTF